MSSKPHRPLHIYFLPMMAQGHMIPFTDMARLFARHGAKTTIVLTPLNADLYSKTIERERELGFDIHIRLMNYPYAEAGLPEGCENQSSMTSQEMSLKVFKVIELLQQPFEQLLEEDCPDCLVADLYFPWATKVAAKHGIPRLSFHGTNLFALCVHHVIHRQKPHEKTDLDSETFVVPNLPDTIVLAKRVLPDYMRSRTESYASKLIEQVVEADLTSYGVVVNSFHELEPAYFDHYRNVMGRKTWCVGPVSLCNTDFEDKLQRGSGTSTDEHKCMNWLSSKKPNSVLYVCFGSMSSFSNAQLREIAFALEAYGGEFIWVVRKEKPKEDKEGNEEWLPEGYEKRLNKKGVIIRGWAPQVLVLEHEAVGGFMTHCGWNSMLEGMTAGVPMVTWPLFAEQFYNEKLATEILRVGVGVGAQDWCRWPEEGKIYIRREDIQKAVTRVMVGEKAEDMRRRAKSLGDMAKRAVEEGGSSQTDLNDLLEELRCGVKLPSKAI